MPKAKPLTKVIVGGKAYEQGLPLPFVDYWKLYATFIGFSAEEGAPGAICDCARPALANAIRIERVKQANGVQPINVSRRLPMWATDVTFDQLPDDPDEATGAFRSAQRICHRCNMASPTRWYCVPMYGGSFKRMYGWYISQNHLRFGVAPTSLVWLPEVTPPELSSLLSDIPPGKGRLSRDSDGRGRIDRDQNILRSVERVVENVTRSEFGVAAIGEGWVSESLLAQLVQSLLPDVEVVRHLRPNWLDGLEIDIWVPSLKLAIEYQGQQHFHPITAWGGDAALHALQDRDKRKAAICKAVGVRLVTIDYTEPLTPAHVGSRIAVGSRTS